MTTSLFATSLANLLIPCHSILNRRLFAFLLYKLFLFTFFSFLPLACNKSIDYPFIFSAKVAFWVWRRCAFEIALSNEISRSLCGRLFALTRRRIGECALRRVSIATRRQTPTLCLGFPSGTVLSHLPCVFSPRASQQLNPNCPVYQNILTCRFINNRQAS